MQPRTRTPGQGWKRVAGWLAYAAAWLFTVWFVAPLSYAWSFRTVRWPLFPVRLAWHVLRIITAPVWVSVRAVWRRSASKRGSLTWYVRLYMVTARRSAVRTAAELYGVSR